MSALSHGERDSATANPYPLTPSIPLLSEFNDLNGLLSVRTLQANVSCFSDDTYCDGWAEKTVRSRE